jgi:hypothetical protein
MHHLHWPCAAVRVCLRATAWLASPCSIDKQACMGFSMIARRVLFQFSVMPLCYTIPNSARAKPAVPAIEGLPNIYQCDSEHLCNVCGDGFVCDVRACFLVFCKAVTDTFEYCTRSQQWGLQPGQEQQQQPPSKQQWGYTPMAAQSYRLEYIQTLEGHTDRVWHLAWSPDGAWRNTRSPAL